MPFLTDSKAKIKRDFPRARPENQVPLYLQCLQGKNSIKRKPKWDAPPESLTLEIAKTQQKLADAEVKLRGTQAGRETRRKILDQQWADLERKEEGFKKAFIKYNEFLKENAEKRQRCKIKIQMDNMVTENREQEIKALQKKYDAMFGVKRHMEDMIKKHQIYENFLRSVVEATDKFAHPTDILARYDVLLQARQFTLERQEHAINFLETAESDINFFIDEKTESIRIISNKVAQMLSRYEEARKKSLYWERYLENIKQHMHKSAEDISAVKSSAWGLYQDMCKRKGEEIQFEKWDVENHLLYIKATLKGMESIAARATTIKVKPKTKAKAKLVKPDDKLAHVRVVWRNSINQDNLSKRSSASTINSIVQ